MMKAPLRPGTRPVGAATLAVEDTSTDTYYLLTTPTAMCTASVKDRRYASKDKAHLAYSP